MEAHLVEGEMLAGAEIGLHIDQTLTQDATGTVSRRLPRRNFFTTFRPGKSK